MKKLISTILALVMVLAVVATVPMTVGAAETLNTSRYFAPDSNSGLSAFYGTPDFVNQMGTTFGAINGKANYTLKDSTWDNALKVTMNPTATSQVNKNGITDNNDYDIWLLWDKDNLYVLQDTRKLFTLKSGESDLTMAEIKANDSGYTLGVWGTREKNKTINVEHSYYHILLPRDITDTGDANKRPKAYAVATFPCLNDTTVASYNVYETVSLVRDFEYSNTDNVTTDKTMFNGDTVFGWGVRTFVERLDTGYRTATVIPWSAIDSTADDAFAALSKEAKVGQTIGVWVWNNWNKHIYNDGFKYDGMTGTGNPNDTAGFDTVALLASKDDVEAPVNYYVDKIEADIDYWLNATTGQFIVKSPMNGGKTYEISTAAQLMGLANILEAGTGDHSLSALGIESSNKADKAYISKGNVFKLTADIDFNPGVTDWGKVNEYYVKKNNGENVDITTVGTLLPTNVFVGFDRFFGTLDGQGHTVKGLFNPDTKAVSWRGAGVTNATGGFIGQLCQGGIVNINVESGYVGTSKLEGNVMFGGLVGEIRTEALTDYKKSITIANVNVGKDYTVHRYGVSAATDKNVYAYGGVASSVWPGIKDKATTFKVSLENIVFSGTLLDNAENIERHGSRTDLVLGNNFKTIAHEVSNGTTKLSITYSNIMGNVSAVTNDNLIKTSRYTVINLPATGEATIPEGKEGYFVHLTDGTVVPHAIAEMLSDVKWQATKANENGKFNVRFVAETESLNWQKIGFEVILKSSEAPNGHVYNNYSNQSAYTSILAAGEKKTADDFECIDGDYLYTYEIKNLDASKTYWAEVKTYFTDANGNLYVSAVVHNIDNIVAWSGN